MEAPSSSGTFAIAAQGAWQAVWEGQTMAWLSLVYVVDLALFVLVFWIIRSRRASARVKTAVILTAVVLYLTSLVVLIFISAKHL